MPELSVSLTKGSAFIDNTSNFKVRKLVSKWIQYMMNSIVLENTDNQSVQCTIGFIENIWNRNKIDLLSDYLRPGFIDYALPPGFKAAKGLSRYLTELMENIDHQTRIEQVEVKQEFVFIRGRVTLCLWSNPKEKQLGSDKVRPWQDTGSLPLLMAA